MHQLKIWTRQYIERTRERAVKTNGGSREWQSRRSRKKVLLKPQAIPPNQNSQRALFGQLIDNSY